MIAILTVDEILKQMLTLEATRGGFSLVLPETATVWLLDLDHPPRPLPQKFDGFSVGFSRTLTTHTRADLVLPLPYSTEELQKILKAAHTKSGIGSEVRHLPGMALINGKKIELSPTEERIFALLLAKRGQTVSETELTHALGESTATSNVLQVHIYRLRRKLMQIPDSGITLRAMRGVGYRIN